MPAATVLLTLVCWKAGAAEIWLPGFMGAAAGTPVAYFSPLLVVMTVLHCLDRRLDGPELTAVVRIPLHDLSAVAATVALGHLAGTVVGMDVARNLMLLLAVALVVRRFGNEAAAGAACLMVLLGSAVLGRTYQYGGHAVARWWALPLHPAQSAGAWAGSAVLLVAAMLVSRAETRGSRMGS